MKIKKKISSFLFLSLIFQNFAFAVTNGKYDKNTIPDKPNAECYFVFDKLASQACISLYNKNGGDIRKMMEDFKTFNSCLVSNCGLYQTSPSNVEASYQYKMEIEKKCIYDSESSLNFDELQSTDWFVNLNININNNANVSKTQTQKRFIPFKVIKYRCPNFKEIKYNKTERVLQFPVLCFKTNNISLNNKILECLEEHKCNDLNQNIKSNLKKFVKYIYCDKDLNGDGFPEALSPALQQSCNRSDAASLRCEKNEFCINKTKCTKFENETKTSYEYKTCKALKRSYKDYTIKVNCGDIEDIYQENPNCIRINSVTSAREEGIEIHQNGKTTNLNKPLRYIEIKNYPSNNDYTNSYNEIVLYHKDGSNIKERFVALVYPKAIYKVKKSFTAIGKILNVISGGLLSLAYGDSSIGEFISASAIGNGFVSNTKSIPPTVVDNVLRSAINSKYPITTNKDVKGITFKIKKSRRFLRKKTRIYMMKAWWDASLIEQTNLANPKSEDWIWNGRDRRNIHFYFKIKMNPDTVLVLYTINAKDNFFSSSDIYYKRSNDLQCGNNAASTANTKISWRKVVDARAYPANSPSIENIVIFLTYPSLYLFEFYNNEEFVGSFYKNFGYDNGEYPIKDLNLKGHSEDEFSSKMYDLYVNKYKSIIINNTVEKYINTPEIKNKINILTDSLLKTFRERNKDEILKKEKPFTSYKDFSDFADFWKLKYAFEYYKNNSNNDNLCETSTSESLASSSGSGNEDLSDENNLENTNNDILMYKKCLTSIPNENNIMNNLINSNSDLIRLDKKRLSKLKEYTMSVYKDFTQRIPNTVNYYLNKEGNRYTLTTSMGSWLMSFKSACGDYAIAKNNALSNYLNKLNNITRNYFSTEASNIAQGLVSLIDRHMNNVTLKYKYTIYRRTGESKWDNYHSAIAGSYSCSYTVGSTCYNSNGNAYSCKIERNASGSCYTYGIAITSPCTASCSGYVNSYYGSQPNPCGDRECDVRNDWDASCNAYYTYYKSSDNAGNGNKTVDNRIGDKYFDSYGSYTCDRYRLSPTGNSIKHCRELGHDLIHVNYRNTIVGYGTWTSTAKKLNTSTSQIISEENNWLERNNYKDNRFINNTLWNVDNKGFNSVRVALSTNTKNAISKESDEYIKSYIREYVTKLIREYLKEKITYELETFVKGDSFLEEEIKKQNKNLLNETINSLNYKDKYAFKPFNTIVIRDMLADPDSPFTINYSIRTPSGILIKNPNALNIQLLSFPEVRKYRCYYNFDTCYKNDNKCQLDSYLEYNNVNDFTGKSVTTLRDEVYKCKIPKKVKKCVSYQVINNCVNIKTNNSNIEYDDNDFSEYFGKSVGENLAFNEALHIFSGRKLKCENGLFTDFSWATDPAFLASVALTATSYISSNTSAGKALKGWFTGKSTTDSCAAAWMNCMAKHGVTPSTAISSGVGASASCDEEVRKIAGCRSFSGVSGLAGKLQLVMNSPFVKTLSDPVTILAAQVAYNLAFNTFDKCNQCINEKCAESHKPEEAKTLFKMTKGKKEIITGAKYGLGEDFKAYGQCFFKDRKCAKHLFGSCIRHKEEYCCYNTKIARILAGQIYEQLGLTYKDNGCNAIKITDLERIDFSPCPEGVIPSPSNKCINYKELENYINSKINWNLKGSFDMNKLIQSVMNAGAE